MVQLEHRRNHLGVAAVETDAGKADFSILLGDALRFEDFVVDHIRSASAMQVPDVEVVGLQLLQAGFEVRQRGLPVLAQRLT